MAPDVLDMKDCEICFGEQGKGKLFLLNLIRNHGIEYKNY